MTQHAQRPLSAIVYARDLGRLVRFYETVLALAREDAGPTYVALESEALELVVVQAPDDVVAATTVADPPAARQDTPLKCSFRVDDIEALRDRIVEAGGVLKPAEAAWSWRGTRHLDGHDPEGNVFQLRQDDA